MVESYTVVHGNSAAPRNTKRTFLISGTVYKGRGVCYNWDITDATAEQTSGGSSISAGITVWCDARRVQVEAPDYGNNVHFAGVVDEASDSKTGPCWITVHEPGSICEIYAKSAATVGSASPYRNTGQIMNFLVDYSSTLSTPVAAVATSNGEFYDGGFLGTGAAQLLAENSAGTYCMAQLLTGPPSGGIQRLSLLSTLAGVTVIKHGVVLMSAAAAGTVIACLISVGSGSFVGQHLLFKMAAAAGTATLECQPRISVAAGVVAAHSLESYGGANQYYIAATTWALLTAAANDRVDLVWDGVKWIGSGTPAVTA